MVLYLGKAIAYISTNLSTKIMAKQSKKEKEKIEDVMHEFKAGELMSGKNGINGKVTNRKQAIAIALSEAEEVIESPKSKKSE